MSEPSKQKADRVIRVNSKTIKFWKEQLARKTPNNEQPYGEAMDEVAKTFSIAGTRYETVLKLVNSDRGSDCGPYLDAILFADGSEQCVLDADREVLEGRYEFRDSVENRDVIIEVREIRSIRKKLE